MNKERVIKDNINKLFDIFEGDRLKVKLKVIRRVGYLTYSGSETKIEDKEEYINGYLESYYRKKYDDKVIIFYPRITSKKHCNVASSEDCFYKGEDITILIKRFIKVEAY